MQTLTEKDISVGQLAAELELNRDQLRALEMLLDRSGKETVTIEEVGAARNADADGFAYDMVDVYTGYLLDWYGQALTRICYADQAIEEGVGDNLVRILIVGQYLYMRQQLETAQEKLGEWLNANRSSKEEKKK